METLRFLMVTSHFPPSHLGGDAMYVKYLAEELVSIGHEVDVFYNPGAYRLVRKRKPPCESETTQEAIRVHPYLSGFQRTEPLISLTLGRWNRAEKTLRELARAVNPDVVHWHNTKGFVANPVKIGSEISLYTAHDYYSICPRSNLVRPDMTICEHPRYCQLCLLKWKKPPQLWRMMGLRVLNLPTNTIVISPSNFVAERLQKDGVRVGHVLRNFVLDPVKDSESEPVRKRDLVMYLGMLERHKGPQRLLDAFIESMAYQGFTLSIVGDGPLKGLLESLVQKARAQDKVTVHGFLPRAQVLKLMKEASALIVPSEWHENAPLVALEAFACGTPVLGSNLGGLPEILTEDSGSRTFRGRDTNDLARAITQLWTERGNLRELGKKARRTYDENYSPEVHVSTYLDILRSPERAL